MPTATKKTPAKKVAAKRSVAKKPPRKQVGTDAVPDVIPDEQALRAQIDVVGLLDRLGQSAKGELEMSATEIRSAELLLKKVLPDLKTSDARMLIASPRFVISADPMTVNVDDWAEKFGALDVPATDGLSDE